MREKRVTTRHLLFRITAPASLSLSLSLSLTLSLSLSSLSLALLLSRLALSLSRSLAHALSRSLIFSGALSPFHNSPLPHLLHSATQTGDKNLKIHTRTQGTKRIKEWLQLGNNARLEIDYWYERLVDEEPFKQEVKDIKIDDYQYGIGTRVGEDQATIA